MSDPGRVVRVANGQGFWGDDREAPVRQVEGGPIDYLVLDYLAEVTMSILRRLRDKDSSRGYATDFVHLMERIFPECVRRGIRVVANAGGVNPRACAEAVVAAGRRAGVSGQAVVAVVTGDDLMDKLDELLEAGHALTHLESGEPLAEVRDRVRSANAYLGAEPLVRALEALRGRNRAGVVVTGRCADASLTLGPLVHEFGWGVDAHDLLACGTVAGHVLECGAQATGGNCMARWWEVPDLTDVGFPIAEVASDGDFVVTKHAGTGGGVSRASVAEQILYEIGDPSHYATPDVVADFSGLWLEDAGPDRVRVQGARGRPRPKRLKVSVGVAMGWRAAGTLTFAWPDAALKARAAEHLLRNRLDRLGLRFTDVIAELVGWDSTHGPLAGEPPRDLPEVQLRFGVRAASRAPVERFTREIAPLVLTGPPSATGYLGGRPRVQEVIGHWPAFISRRAVEGSVAVKAIEV